MMKRSVVLSAAMLVACSSSDDAGKGTVSFNTYGEDYIEKEIPAADVEDGWTVKYTKFLINLGEVAVGEPDATPVVKMPVAKIYDMTKPGEKLVFSAANVAAKAFTHVSYAIAPATAATELGEGASDADKALMTSGGFSVYVEASATKGADTKTFKWGFTTNTLYDRCEGEISGKKTEGVVVTNGGTDNVQITIHGDHLFYDDLQADNAKVRFDAIAAADANKDGTVTLEELAAVTLAGITAGGSYGTGSATGINDLRAFVTALSRTLGHFRGEGECFAKER